MLRFVVNPFLPKRIPYCAVPYELNPYAFFGIGVGENMDDTQTLMNGFMRMAVDNAVLSGNLLIEVDETNLTPGQDLTVYPGKVFRRQGGAPGQAIFGTKFPNVSTENMQLFDKARVLADESTGIPSFSHGQTGVSGVGRTAAGISMLMGAAAGSIKTVVKNFDDYMLRPLGQAMFAFNMQFNYNKDIKGDLEVKARGLESLMQNEVRSQRLMSFLQIVSNPVLAPFAKFPFIIREIAKSMMLDANKVTNTPEEMLRQTYLMQKNQEAMGQGGPEQQPMDMSGVGGGNIGVGAAPVPGEQQFTGQPPQQAQPAQQQQLDPDMEQWAQKNPWFMGSEPIHREMTSFAMYVDQRLQAQGIDPAKQSEKYYSEVDNKMRNEFPSFFGVQANNGSEMVDIEETPKRQPSQVVATATRDSGNKKPTQIRLTKTQVKLARELGITPEKYANQLLKES